MHFFLQTQTHIHSHRLYLQLGAFSLFVFNLQADDGPNLLAKEELNLLARLMGSMKVDSVPRVETRFRINLFNTDQEEEQA